MKISDKCIEKLRRSFSAIQLQEEVREEVLAMVANSIGKNAPKWIEQYEAKQAKEKK